MDARRRVDFRLPAELMDRVNAEADRLGQTRTKFVERALVASLGRGAVEDDVPSPSRSSVAEQAAAPVSSLESRGLRNLHETITDPRLSPFPGVVRGSSLAKSGVRPIPKGKGK
jgi:hypothetical protein